MDYDVLFGTLVEYRGEEEYAQIPTEAVGSGSSECGFVRLHDPRAVTVIGKAAFMGNQKLKGVTIPDQVKNIERYAFYDCRNLLGISIPDSVLSIGERAFSCCESLSEVDLGHGVKSISWEAFSGCESLKSIAIPESVIRIERNAFKDCHPDFIIFGKRNTAAEDYAKENGIEFEEIE